MSIPVAWEDVRGDLDRIGMWDERTADTTDPLPISCIQLAKVPKCSFVSYRYISGYNQYNEFIDLKEIATPCRRKAAFVIGRWSRHPRFYCARCAELIRNRT